MTCENINLLPRRAVNLERQSIIHPGLLSQTSPAFSLTHFLSYTQREEERPAHKTLYSPIVWALLSCLVMSCFPFPVMEKRKHSEAGRRRCFFFLWVVFYFIFFSSSFVDLVDTQHYISLGCTVYWLDLPTSWSDYHNKLSEHPSSHTDTKLHRGNCFSLWWELS